MSVGLLLSSKRRTSELLLLNTDQPRRHQLGPAADKSDENQVVYFRLVIYSAFTFTFPALNKPAAALASAATVVEVMVVVKRASN